MLAAGFPDVTYDQSQVQVELMNVQLPQPKPRQVLIKVQGSSVNHLDMLWRVLDPASWLPFNLLWKAQFGFPKVLGLDVAGTVVSTGFGASDFQIGDEVWGFNAAGTVFDGRTLGGIAGHTWAEYVTVDQSAVALKPSSLSMAEAGSMPLVAQTILYALKKAGAPWQGGTVLILGATGGTGHIAIQLAKILGAGKVIATASASSKPLVDSLGGVDMFIDYRTQDWTELIPDGSLDAVIDTVLQDGSGDKAFAKLASNGKFVSLCKGIPTCGAPMANKLSEWNYPTVKQYSVRCTAGSCAGREQLDELRSYVESGQLKVLVQDVLPLENIKDAVALLDGGHVKGKIALSVGGSLSNVTFV